MTLGAGLVALIKRTSHLTDPLLPIGGSQALCQVDAEAHLDSAPPQSLIGRQEMMDVATKGNSAMIGLLGVSTNTTLFAGEVRAEASVEAESRSAAWGEGGPGSAGRIQPLPRCSTPTSLLTSSVGSEASDSRAFVMATSLTK